jgi:Carboxypeptidase regulatory-like domain
MNRSFPQLLLNGQRSWKRSLWLSIHLLFGITAQSQPSAPSLHGIISDPSEASVPGALVRLRGPSGNQRTRADSLGRYSFAALRPGKYVVRVIAEGFRVDQRNGVEISGPTELDLTLVILAETQVVNVEDESNRINADPESNGTSLTMGEKELAALSDDSDELLQELQAIANVGAGPNGSQVHIDGFNRRHHATQV